MTIYLSGDRERFVRSLVEDGDYPSENEVVEEALRMLQERTDQTKVEELRRELAIGIEQADRGELVPFDPLATLARIRSQESAATRPD